MEHPPERPELPRRDLGDPADPEQLHDLKSMALKLVDMGMAILDTESCRNGRYGKVRFGEHIESADSEYDEHTTSITIFETESWNGHARPLAELVFDLDQSQPTLITHGDVPKLEDARKVCTDLILNGELNEIETALTYFAISQLAGFIDRDYMPASGIRLPDGKVQKPAIAIMQAIGTRNKDYCQELYYEHTDEEAGTKLYISRYEATNIHRYPQAQSLQIQLHDRTANRIIQLRLEDDGEAWASETGGLAYDEAYPDVYQLEMIQNAVLAALAYEHKFSSDQEITVPQAPAWQTLVRQIIVAALELETKQLGTPEFITAQANLLMFENQAARAFENHFHLLPGVQPINLPNPFPDGQITAQGNRNCLRFRPEKLMRYDSTGNIQDYDYEGPHEIMIEYQTLELVKFLNAEDKTFKQCVRGKLIPPLDENDWLAVLPDNPDEIGFTQDYN